MDASTLVRLLARRRQLARQDQWTRRQLEVHQAAALRDLRDFAVARSSFYRERHAGLERRPLHELPVVTKAELMERFDEVVTDGDVHLPDLEAWIETMRGDALFHDRHRVAATSGTTGQRGVFLWGPDEWVTVLASYTRANDWAGVRAGLTRRMKLAVVSSRTPWHGSAVAATSLNSPIVPTLRLDATDPMSEIVRKLNEFQPENLVAYASMARILAEEQLAGRLHITPKAVMSASEVLTTPSRARIHEAFGVQPFDVYATTETANIAAECSEHNGLHLYEDLVVTEVVDEQNRPVPPGSYGAKVLVTVLFARTLPLIRYEMSDSLMVSGRVCPCGRPFAMLEGVQGRSDEVLWLTGESGQPVAIHPVVFHRLVAQAPVQGWQVVQEPTRLRVDVAGPGPGFDANALATSIRVEVSRTGAVPPTVEVVVVDAVQRGRTGKAALVRALRSDR